MNLFVIIFMNKYIIYRFILFDQLVFCQAMIVYGIKCIEMIQSTMSALIVNICGNGDKI